VVYQDLLAPSTSPEYWQELIAEAETSYSDVLSEFIKQFGTINGPENSRRFIEKYQVMCADMVNSIDRMHPLPHPLTQEAGSKYREVALQLLEFLESHYAQLMNLGIPLPVLLSNKVCTGMVERIKQLRARYAEHRSELFPLLEVVLAKDLGNPLPLTYGRYFVWKKVLAGLEVMQLSITEYRTFDCNIREVLMQYNFNAKDFVDFYKKKLDEDLSPLEKGLQRVSRIAFHRRYLKSINGHKWLIYDSEKPCLIKALLKYLKLLEKQQNLLLEQPGKEAARVGESTTRLKTAVQQKSFVRLMLAISQIGLVKPKSKKQFADWICNSFSKENGEPISPSYVKRMVSSTVIDDNEETLEALETLMQSLED
jgi:hypothetical protein